MGFAPKYLLKRIFPNDCMATLDTTGDGRADVLQIQGTNVLSPFKMPETVDLGDLDIDKIDQIATLMWDGTRVPFTKGDLFANLSLWIQGTEYSIKDILEGKAKGVTIALGHKITLHFRFQAVPDIKPGPHTLRIEWNDGRGDPTVLDFDRDIPLERIGVPFDPSSM